jgi:tRNA (cmo5U34)-methyltransferase
MNKQDRIFAEAIGDVSDFDFGEKTAEVFDDMLDRSIPQYRELLRMVGEITGEFAENGTRLYDLGCSTGLTLASLHEATVAAGKSVSMVGVDYSQPMLDRAKERFGHLPESERPHLVCADLNQGYTTENASVTVLNLTLQFIRPLYRDNLIRNIVSGLNDNGCLILVEKVLSDDTLLNRTFIKFYYDMKRRNGYTETEIAKKREALENVLIPYRMAENTELLKRNGFAAVDTFFKWYNFCGILAVKRCNA